MLRQLDAVTWVQKRSKVESELKYDSALQVIGACVINEFTTTLR